ncbi:MAG: carboxymuconolactone decarboxylase family protein [Exilibacterium sp.]
MTIKETHKEIEQALGQVPVWMEKMPDGVLEGFWSATRDFWLAETVIPNKYKELIGVAISGATRCRYCALFHTESAKAHGATEAEIAEASAMGAMTMGDFDKFCRETMDIIKYLKAHPFKQTQKQRQRPSAH